MTYLPTKPPTSAPATQGQLPGGLQAGDQVSVYRPGSGTFWIDAVVLIPAPITNHVLLRNGSALTLRDGSYLTHR